MNFRRIIVFVYIISFHISISIQGQSVDLPIHYPLRLSGTFGELRSNHFHAGIDVKSSKGVIGDSLFAIEDGYISRIMVHPSGYGNALYIDHINGLTTVYAHMDRFESSLNQLIRQYQMKERSYIIDFNIAPQEFPVKKGQLIGFLGNTGYSFGPHLHFEIKRTDNQMLINPLHFNYKVVDNVAPEIHGLRVYGLDHLRREVYKDKINIIAKNGQYKTQKDTIKVPANRAAFAIASIDKADQLHHKNGIYRLEMYVDDSLYFSYQMDSFPKKDTRALNAHTDYEQYMFYGNWYHRLHRLPGNNLPLYPFTKYDGLVPLRAGEARSIWINAYDFQGNKSQTQFYVTQADSIYTFKKPREYYLLRYDEPNMIRRPDITILFPEGSLYDNMYFEYFEQKGPSWCVYSKYFKLHTSRIPIHNTIEVSIKGDKIPQELRSKAFLAHCVGATTYNHGGSWDGEVFTGVTHQLGDFCLMIDTVAPRISPTVFYAKATKAKEFKFTITDNFATSRHIEPLQVEAYINDQWVLAAYNSKTKLLTIPLDQVKPGNHRIRIKATDWNGNIGIWEQLFSK